MSVKDGLVTEKGPVHFKLLNTDGVPPGTVIKLTCDTEITKEQFSLYGFYLCGYKLHMADDVSDETDEP